MPLLEAARLAATRRWRALARACEPITSLHGACRVPCAGALRLGAPCSKRKRGLSVLWRLSARATAAAGFAGLRIVAQTASTSLPEARGVLILLVWFCAIFMLAGLQKFAGKTGLRCALCEDEACTVAQLGSVVAPELPCGFAADARRCEAPLVCLPARDNPLSVWTSFNDFRWASLSVLRVALAGVRAARSFARLRCFAHAARLCRRDGGRCFPSWRRAPGVGLRWRFACRLWWVRGICWSRCLRRCSRTCLARRGERMPKGQKRSTPRSRCAAMLRAMSVASRTLKSCAIRSAR